MSAARALTPEELAERWNIRVKRGPRAGQLNVEYCLEKARRRTWPAIRPPGSRLVLFAIDWVEAVENQLPQVETTRPARSLKIERTKEIGARSHRKERTWER